MTKYVCGFLFNPTLDAVALIKKLKPAWQRGKLNGIGGKIEPGELALAAMVREFKEETGALVTNWAFVGEIAGEDYSVIFYTAWGDPQLDSPTDEEVIWMDISSGVKDAAPVISNLRWIIPFARLYWGVVKLNPFSIIDHNGFSATD